MSSMMHPIKVKWNDLYMEVYKDFLDSKTINRFKFLKKKYNLTPPTLNDIRRRNTIVTKPVYMKLKKHIAVEKYEIGLANDT